MVVRDEATCPMGSPGALRIPSVRKVECGLVLTVLFTGNGKSAYLGSFGFYRRLPFVPQLLAPLVNTLDEIANLLYV